jgi:YhcN/YlaJ family sporulation lipoprotein
MRKVLTVLMVILLSLSAWGCGNNEKAKGGEKKVSGQKQQQQQQTLSKAKDNQNESFNHSASIKMANAIGNIPGVTDPIIVVYGKEAVVAYKKDTKTDEQVLNKRIQKELQKEMPNYKIQVGSKPDWYNKAARLYEDTIESEGRTIENLGDSFRNLKNQ